MVFVPHGYKSNKSNIGAHSIDTYLFGARQLVFSIYPRFALREKGFQDFSVYSVNYFSRWLFGHINSVKFNFACLDGSSQPYYLGGGYVR